jgi:nucleotide-binding universal stress UspA family protein
MFEKILVPLGCAGLSEGILPYVSQLAKGLKAQVVFLAVIDSRSVDELPIGTVEQTGELQAHQPFELLKRRAMARLDEGAKSLDDDGEVTTLCVVTVGEPSEEIVRVADREGCGLIAMTTHTRSNLWRVIRVSVATRVLHSANVPTLIVAQRRTEGRRPQQTSIISKLLVALDGSRLAETVLPYVEHLARELSLEVVLVQVLDRGEMHGLTAIEAFEKLAGEYLQTIAEKLRTKGLTVRWQLLLHGRPAASIVDLAREERENIIVLASHGRSRPLRLIKGSVVDAVATAPESPVLVITPKANG